MRKNWIKISGGFPAYPGQTHWHTQRHLNTQVHINFINITVRLRQQTQEDNSLVLKQPGAYPTNRIASYIIIFACWPGLPWKIGNVCVNFEFQILAS